MNSSWITSLGAFLGFLSVALGAFGAHGLKNKLSPRMLEVFQTGVTYQMYHALALVLLGVWAGLHPKVNLSLPAGCFLAGVVLFSGSLYGLSLSGIKQLGAITPLGGVCFLVGWISFAYLAYRG